MDADSLPVVNCNTLCPYWDAGYHACWKTYPKSRETGECPYIIECYKKIFLELYIIYLIF